MTLSETMIIVTAIIEIAMILFILHMPPGRSIRAFAKLMIINMFLIAIFGGRTKEVFGHATNIGNIMFAAVLLAQAIVVRRWGRIAALENVVMIFIAMVIMFVLAQTIKYTPAAPGDPIAESINAVLSGSAKVAHASFVAFAIVQYVFVEAMWRLRDWPTWLSYGLTAVAAQALDSAIFFGVAFGASADIETIIGMAVVGFVIKAGFAMLTVPIVAAARVGKHPCEGCPMAFTHSWPLP